MKRPASPQDNARLLAFIVDAVQKHLQRDAGIRAACASLQQGGLSLVVRLELSPGDAPPRVTAHPRGPGVPEWTEEDAEILRSLGIARDDSNAPDGSAPEPDRHQPR